MKSAGIGTAIAPHSAVVVETAPAPRADTGRHSQLGELHDSPLAVPLFQWPAFYTVTVAHPLVIAWPTIF